MKRLIGFALLSLLFVFSCTREPDTIPVTNVTLNSSSVDVVEGDSFTLVATVSPSNATNKTVLWTTSHSSIATVEKGVVYAVSPGQATITAISDDGGKKATCTVHVGAKVIPVSALSLNKTSTSLRIGESEALIATVAPENATDKAVIWSVEDSAIATVSSEGVVTAVSVGNTTVTVASSDGLKKATCIVSVLPIDVSEISLNKTSVSLRIGESETLVATVIPEDATDKAVIWSVEDSAIATVSSEGVVTAVSVGNTTVNVASSDGKKKATCTVSVLPINVSEISLNKQYLSLYITNSVELTATILPSNATDQSITWSSSDSRVAKVSSTGVVTAIAPGDVVITAKTNDGGKTASCSVAVWPDPSEGIDLGTSVKWAVRNVGATLPEDFGDHFSWGETAPKSNYSENNYKWTNGSEDGFIKYNTLASNGIVDNRIILEPEDDAAHVNWGGAWRTPTKGEIQELIDGCEWTWTKQGDRPGYRVSSRKNGNSIFLPAAGYRNYSSIDYDNEMGIYMSASLCSDTPYYYFSYRFSPSHFGGSGALRFFGYSVRPVMDSEDRVRVSGISVSPTNISLTEGSTAHISASISPSNATNQEVYWISSDSSVASVTDGTIHALIPGVAIITATTIDGGYTATCSITVEPDKTKVTSLSFGGTALYVGPGNSYSLTVIAKPDDAVGSYTWKSSDSGTVSVSGNGKTATVTPNYASTGYTTVSVTDQRTGISASIKVYSFIQNFSWNESTGETYGGYPLITIPVGGTYQLKYSSGAGSSVLNLFGDLNDFVFYEPTYAVSSPTNISISPEGLVTGLKEGTTGIKPTGYIQASGSRVYFKVASKMYESEYNDTKDYANNVPYGFPMVFSLMNRTDVDWFKLQTKSSSGYISVTLSVEYSGASSLSGNEGRLCKYTLYDSSMQLWGSGSFSFSNSSPTVSITKSTIPAGPLYLKIYFDTSYDSRLCPLDNMTLKLTEN